MERRDYNRWLYDTVYDPEGYLICLSNAIATQRVDTASVDARWVVQLPVANKARCGRSGARGISGALRNISDNNLSNNLDGFSIDDEVKGWLIGVRVEDDNPRRHERAGEGLAAANKAFWGDQNVAGGFESIPCRQNHFLDKLIALGVEMLKNQRFAKVKTEMSEFWHCHIGNVWREKNLKFWEVSDNFPRSIG